MEGRLCWKIRHLNCFSCLCYGYCCLYEKEIVTKLSLLVGVLSIVLWVITPDIELEHSLAQIQNRLLQSH